MMKLCIAYWDRILYPLSLNTIINTYMIQRLVVVLFVNRS